LPLSYVGTNSKFIKGTQSSHGLCR